MANCSEWKHIMLVQIRAGEMQNELVSMVGSDRHLLNHAKKRNRIY